MARPTEIDLLYGLEPVFEPSEEGMAGGLDPQVDVACPYCGEALWLQLDLSAGTQSYVEDCQVCCQPMQVDVQVDLQAALQGVTVQRMDR